jgi:translation initiation factor IF-2
MRVHTLAKELNVSSKVILEKCKAEGLDNIVKNHMSTVSAGLYATILEWFSDGEHSVAIETSVRVDLKKVRTKPKRKKKAQTTEPEKAVKAEVKKAAEEPAALPVGVAVEAAPAPPAVTMPVVIPVETAPSMPMETAPSIPVEAAPPIKEEPAEPEGTPALEKVAEAPVMPEAPPDEATRVAAEIAPEMPAKEEEEPRKTAEPAVTVGLQNVPAPSKLKGPRVVRYEPLEVGSFPARRPVARDPRPAVGSPGEAPKTSDSPATRRGAAKTTPRRSRLNPRRTAERMRQSSERLAEWRDRDLAERNERLAGATGRRHRRRATQLPQKAAEGDSVEALQAKVHEPVRMKEFCSETGLNFVQCFKVLRDEHGILANINMTLPNETAQLLALTFGMELEIVPARTQLDVLREEAEARERKHLAPRPPVVTMLGHVDHGKTSLLDMIRKTHVVAAEDGGITQHIGAHHVRGARGAVTFLDTPGHKAFSAMRARGAQLTDVAVLVVAADDGVMPQTIEAINHAKSAEVPIVVALNKIDLGEENILKIYGELAEQGLTPSGDWGGETDVIHTSATGATGISELVNHLADLSELLDLKADAELPAVGTVIEAETKTGVGPVVSVLVQEGTLRVGDVVVCGNGFGKVRALLDGQGQRVRSVGPSMPAEVWGLDDVPNSGDRLYCVDSLQRAKGIATEVKQSRIESARLASRTVLTLEAMFKQRDADEIPELNVILKGDGDGSVQTLRETLATIPSDEVKLTIRHAGVGAITDGDVLLAATCKGLIVAYRVEAPATVRKLADHHGVEIRGYRVIYDVSDDVKKALEGLLTPEEHVETRATAEVRDIFRISKLGLVAGCHVTDGTVDRKHLVKVIRDGVVVREGCRINSLRRFKDDAKEVRAGLECGIRLDGFDDVHAGDIIETYEIIKTARTL